MKKNLQHQVCHPPLRLLDCQSTRVARAHKSKCLFFVCLSKDTCVQATIQKKTNYKYYYKIIFKMDTSLERDPSTCIHYMYCIIL